MENIGKYKGGPPAARPPLYFLMFSHDFLIFSDENIRKIRKNMEIPYLLTRFLARFLTRFLARVLTRVLTRVWGRGKTINTVYSTTRPKEINP